MEQSEAIEIAIFKMERHPYHFFSSSLTEEICPDPAFI